MLQSYCIPDPLPGTGGSEVNKCPSYLLLHKTAPGFVGQDSRLLFCSQIRS